MRRGALLIAVIALLAAGCGGTKTYSLAKTRACLVAKHATIDHRLDFVASTATGGAFRALLPKNFVTVAFGDNEKDAEQIELAYNRFAFANGKKGLPDVLKRDRNVVMLWHQHPQNRNLNLVMACLK